MIRRGLKFLFLFILIFVMLGVTLAVVTNVPTKPTESDEAIFKTVLALQKPHGPMNYEQELNFIRRIQSLVLKEAPGNVGIPEYSTREPEDLFKARSGLCYDRSRTLDKLLLWAGFESRHVYILYAKHPKNGVNLSFWDALFTMGTHSHAVTEVKTSRGWMVVDSNSPWISEAADGEPVNADYIHAQAYRFVSLPEYFNRPYWAIRGMYSRRGQFYRPHIPFPQLNWPDFFLWLSVG